MCMSSKISATVWMSNACNVRSATFPMPETFRTGKARTKFRTLSRVAGTQNWVDRTAVQNASKQVIMISLFVFTCPFGLLISVAIFASIVLLAMPAEAVSSERQGSRPLSATSFLSQSSFHVQHQLTSSFQDTCSHLINNHFCALLSASNLFCCEIAWPLPGVCSYGRQGFWQVNTSFLRYHAAVNVVRDVHVCLVQTHRAEMRIVRSENLLYLIGNFFVLRTYSREILFKHATACSMLDAYGQAYLLIIVAHKY